MIAAADTMIDSNPAISIDQSAAIWEIPSSASLQELDDWGVLPSTTNGSSQSLDFAVTTASPYCDSSLDGQNYEVFNSSWPRNLPNPEVTRHLYDTLILYKGMSYLS